MSAIVFMEQKSDFTDYLYLLSGRFLHGFNAELMTVECCILKYEEYKYQLKKFVRSQWIQGYVCSLIDESFRLYKSGYRQTPWLLTQRAAAYWKRDRPKDLTFLRPIPSWDNNTLHEQVSRYDGYIEEEFWGVGVTPQWFRDSLINSIDAASTNSINSSLYARMAENIERCHCCFMAGDTITAKQFSWYADKCATVIRTGDAKYLEKSSKPWLSQSVPAEPWLIG